MAKSLILLVGEAGFGPATFGFGGQILNFTSSYQHYPQSLYH